MITFPDNIKAEIYDAQNSFCANAGCYEPIHSYHHKLKNSDYHRKLFPLFINSPFNCVGLCYQCHKNESHKFRISGKLAKVYEEWLNKL